MVYTKNCFTLHSCFSWIPAFVEMTLLRVYSTCVRQLSGYAFTGRTLFLRPFLVVAYNFPVTCLTRSSETVPKIFRHAPNVMPPLPMERVSLLSAEEITRVPSFNSH